MTRETGPARKIMDADEAQPYISIARNLLGELRVRQELGGVDYLIRRLELPDGTLITALVNHGLAQFEIIPPVEEGEELPICTLGGFLCFPTSSSAPNGIPVGDQEITEPLLYYSENNRVWQADIQFERVAGNIDWRGPDDPPCGRIILTWWGVPGRQRDLSTQLSAFKPNPNGLDPIMGTVLDNGGRLNRVTQLSEDGSEIVFQERLWNHEIYQNGKVLHRAQDPRIAGAALTKIPNPQNPQLEKIVLIYVSSGNRAPHREENVYLYDFESEEEVQLTSIRYTMNPFSTFGDENRTPWFFNESGNRAFAIRYEDYDSPNPDQGTILVRWLYELNFDGQTATINQVELADGITYRETLSGGGPAENGSTTRTGVYEGKALLGVDFIGDKPVYAYEVPGGSFSYNYTWSTNDFDWSKSVAYNDIQSSRLSCPTFPDLELYNFTNTQNGSTAVSDPPGAWNETHLVTINGVFGLLTQGYIGYMDLRFGIIEHGAETHTPVTSSYFDEFFWNEPADPGGSFSSDHTERKPFTATFSYYVLNTLRKNMIRQDSTVFRMQQAEQRLADITTPPNEPNPQLGFIGPGILYGLDGFSATFIQWGGGPCAVDQEENVFWSGPDSVLPIQRVQFSQPAWNNDYYSVIKGSAPASETGLANITEITGPNVRFQPVRIVTAELEEAPDDPAQQA